ncbi:hypothetical protein [Hymenobacter chitinivorans]|uniref:Uncharacterized protein n=1 Tax=Hymenobacter chitinivorans DSM 11115 TaxID=1121954 RepID=A0A2M9BNA1_9BACT|nr:hypothetical protein [Hymenobacter chitinivorans]PJJ59438.1 hypothetical protein CLV45_0855 [Hymenobacter chitinivorans DSM 11115]
MQTPAPLHLKDALELLEAGAPVAVRYVKANRRTKVAGEFGTLPAARLGTGKRTAEAVLRAAPAAEDAAGVDVCPVPVPTPKNPNHYENATRNLVDTRTGELVKVHIYLLVAVAGRNVIL